MKSINTIFLFFISAFSFSQGNRNSNESFQSETNTSIGAESNPEGQEEIDQQVLEDNLIATMIERLVLLEPRYQRYQEDLRNYIFERWRNPQDTDFTPRANQVFTQLHTGVIEQETAQRYFVELVRIILRYRLNIVEQILIEIIGTLPNLTLVQRRHMQNLVHRDRQNLNIPFRLTDTNLVDLQILFERWYQEINPEVTRPRSPVFWNQNNVSETDERNVPSPVASDSAHESPRTPTFSRPGSPKE